MAVSIVACQIPMINPKDALGIELFLQAHLDLSLCHGLITMRGQQATCGSEDRATSVTLDRATFKHKVETIHVFSLKGTLIVELTV